jgi:hypothetical protein
VGIRRERRLVPEEVTAGAGWLLAGTKLGFLEAEDPGKVGVQNIGGRVWEQV